jgi:hypothetical protein
MNKTEKSKLRNKKEQQSEIRTFGDLKDIREDKSIANLSVKRYLDREIETLKKRASSDGLPEIEIKVADVSLHLIMHHQRDVGGTLMDDMHLTCYASGTDRDALHRLLRRGEDAKMRIEKEFRRVGRAP